MITGFVAAPKLFKAQHPQLTRILLELQEFIPQKLVSDQEQPRSGLLSEVKDMHDACFLTRQIETIQLMNIKEKDVILCLPINLEKVSRRRGKKPNS